MLKLLLHDLRIVACPWTCIRARIYNSRSVDLTILSHKLHRYVLDCAFQFTGLPLHLPFASIALLELRVLAVVLDEGLGEDFADLKQGVSPLVQLLLDLGENIVLELHQAIRHHVIVVYLGLIINYAVDLLSLIIIIIFFFIALSELIL